MHDFLCHRMITLRECAWHADVIFVRVLPKRERLLIAPGSPRIGCNMPVRYAAMRNFIFRILMRHYQHTISNFHRTCSDWSLLRVVSQFPETALQFRHRRYEVKYYIHSIIYEHKTDYYFFAEIEGDFIELISWKQEFLIKTKSKNKF